MLSGVTSRGSTPRAVPYDQGVWLIRHAKIDHVFFLLVTAHNVVGDNADAPLDCTPSDWTTMDRYSSYLLYIVFQSSSLDKKSVTRAFKIQDVLIVESGELRPAQACRSPWCAATSICPTSISAGRCWIRGICSRAGVSTAVGLTRHQRDGEDVSAYIMALLRCAYLHGSPNVGHRICGLAHPAGLQ